jgi:hypothetical protein
MPHDNYELPSIYTRKPLESYVDSDDDEQQIGASQEEQDDRMGTLPMRNSYQDIHLEDNRLAWLMLGASFFILLMTVVPVVTDIPYVTPWFPGDALWRLFDPVITLPLNLFIITRADIITNGGRSHYCKFSSIFRYYWNITFSFFNTKKGVH